MPIRPSPRTYTCPACGWSKTVLPRGDALMPGDFVDTCQSCGSTSLESREANAVEKALGGVVQQIKTLLR